VALPARPERPARLERRPARAPKKHRRTQVERREGTIRKLLDAAAETLIEVGYARATVQEICKRAGVSQGGLFRHFATRDDLIIAVTEDIGAQILQSFRTEFEARRGREPSLALAIKLLRDRCRSRPNQVWYELTMASRTNEALRRALAPVALTYYRDIETLAREVAPEVAARFGPDFSILLEMVLAIFDGEALQDMVVPSGTRGERRLDLVLLLLKTMGDV
jgi:AcrR family transcriptional regulator